MKTLKTAFSKVPSVLNVFILEEFSALFFGFCVFFFLMKIGISDVATYV